MENLVSTPWTLTINNSTISLNRAGDAGGGIETNGTGKVNITALRHRCEQIHGQSGCWRWLDAIATGTVTNPVITTGGSGLYRPATVTFTAGAGGRHHGYGIATISGGVVTSIVITNPGAGYVTRRRLRSPAAAALGLPPRPPWLRPTSLPLSKSPPH